MTCPQCGVAVRPNATFCPACGTKIESAAATAALASSATAQPTSESNATKPRRAWRGFVVGLLCGLLLAPVLLWIALQLLIGNNTARRAAPAPINQPDLSVVISRSYLERAIAQNSDAQNPVIELAEHPNGGAMMTLILGLRLPLLGVKDVHTISQVTAEDGRLVVHTEQAGLGEQGQVSIPGDVVERLVSELITNELDKRIHSNPALEIDVIRVGTTADQLTVDAALRQPGK